jgi:hypothetical protein
MKWIFAKNACDGVQIFQPKGAYQIRVGHYILQGHFLQKFR